MRTLTPREFVKKWSQIQLKEIATAQSHFNDVCALVGHRPPLEADPKGEFFAFEATTDKTGGSRGRADVWYQGKFIWEYKVAHADLDKAYQQLLLYRESLGNPPLLITSDTQRIIIHTNFTNTVKKTYDIDFDSLLAGNDLELLKRAFHAPESFKPDQTQEQVTRATADDFARVTDTLKQWERDADPERLAHFIIRLLFCLFAEDMGLLPQKVFTQLVGYKGSDLSHFAASLRGLFAAMRDGGNFGFFRIPHFDGNLFDDDFVPEMPGDVLDALLRACRQDWSSLEPSIFGTLFERVIDASKRAQLGAHYTSRDDIMLIVEPVLMKPLRDHWQVVKRQSAHALKQGEPARAHALLGAFAEEVAAVRVLDPACGSGNFLYVALRQLLDLQKEAIALAGRDGLDEIPLTVSPEQLYGIEIDPYAHELAQITVWIGYLQWRKDNGFADIQEPILRPLKNIRRMDAILAYDADGKPVEPEWPEADVVIGNPPFLGGKKMRTELGDQYIESLYLLYGDRLHGETDLVCYWFEKARQMIEEARAKRAGLLATNSIRGGFNRRVLERIKTTGNIFMAWADRPWVLDGAAVRVSMVGFDDGQQEDRILDGEMVSTISSDLRGDIDLTRALRLEENRGLSFQGINKVGPFDMDASRAKEMLAADGNPNGRPNSDVVKPVRNAFDIAQRSRNRWIIDFGTRMSLDQASQYVLPIAYVRERVKPQRDMVRRKIRRERWWLFGETCPAMRKSLSPLSRYIVTPGIAKHRMFAWLESHIIPDHALIVVAREDDYFFSVLHSRMHESWALRLGTSLEDRPRYTATTTFETFPFPWPPGKEPGENEDERVAAIAQAARELAAFRDAWLNPEGVGITISERDVNKRTLTNLYNALAHYRENVKGKQHNPHQWKSDVGGMLTLEEIETLDHIHNELDCAVLDAYGWPHNLSDEQILERLLALNLQRAKQQNP